MKQNKSKFSALFGAQDMTVGSPTANLLKFSIPLLIGNFVQQLYSTVDSIIVGQYVGDGALAAVGATFPVINLLMVIFIAISTGASIIVSQNFGAKDREELSKAIGNAMILILIASIVMTVVGLIASKPLMRLIGTPDDIFDMSTLYLMIIFGGTIASAFYNILSGILRGLGDSVTPLLYLVIACFLNIVLDYVSVVYLGWSVAGVAIATILSQAVSAVLCVGRLFSMRQTIDLNRNTVRLSRERSRALLKLGLPSGATQAIFSMAMVFVQALTNSLGTMVVATSVVVMRVDGFAMLPNFTFGMAIATFVGQNVGAQRVDRAEQGGRAAAKIALAVSAVLVLLILVFGRGLMGMFTKTQELIDLGAHALRVLAIGYMAMALMQVFAGIMRGAGDTMPSMWISLFTTVIVRVPIAYALAALTKSETWPNGSPDSLYVSMLVAWCVGALLNYLWYRRGNWRNKSVIRRNVNPGDI